MKSAYDRRYSILSILSFRRFATVDDLASEFCVSNATIRRDIEKLSCSAPIYTVQGNGGGIRVADGWYVSKTYFTGEQEELLRDLSKDLDEEQMKIMNSIFATFSIPLVPNSDI